MIVIPTKSLSPRRRGRESRSRVITRSLQSREDRKEEQNLRGCINKYYISWRPLRLCDLCVNSRILVQLN